VYNTYELRRNGHFRGKIQDIKKFGNCLLALIVLPDDQACLYVENMQTYENGYSIPVGKNARRIKLYGREGERPRVVVLDEADDGKDHLWVFDIFGEAKPRMLSLPDGASDYTLRASDDLSVIVYKDDRSTRGTVRFVDMKRLVLEDHISDPYMGGDRVHLSLSQNLVFVYSRQGVLTVIDTDTRRVVDQIKIPGICSGCAVEIY